MEIKRYPIDSRGWYKVPRGWNVTLFQAYRSGENGDATGVYTFEEGRRAFLESATEYEAAMKLVSSWDHWKAIARAPSQKPYIDLWKEEKLLLDQTKARQQLIKAAETGNISASKVLYEAKKEERAQREREKAQQAENQRETSLIQNSSAKILALEAMK